MKKLIIILLFVPLLCQAQIPKDKQLHLEAGAVVGVWGVFTGNSMEYTPEKSLLFGIGAATVAGIGKECMDQFGGWVFHDGNRFDPMDALATTIGGAIGAGLTYAGLKIFKHRPPLIALSDYGVGMKITFRF